jgi:flagellar basal-body rod modification protein FlgD
VESTSTDADGKSTTTTTKMEGKVTGVSISDGSPTIIASSGGKTYQVGIGDISRIGEGVQGN